MGSLSSRQARVTRSLICICAGGGQMCRASKKKLANRGRSLSEADYASRSEFPGSRASSRFAKRVRRSRASFPVREASLPVREASSPVREASLPVREASSPVREASSQLRE